MSNFFIIPPRLIVGSTPGVNVVTSLNGLRGDLIVSADTLSGISASVNNKTITLTILPNFYVKKAGDTFLGNLDFIPTAGKYGLKLLASNVDPTEFAEGAIYFNTNANVLKIYSDGAWLTLAQTGALTQVDGDLRYLKIDASNGPLTGNLSLGTTLLGLGQKNSDPLTGVPGQVYYNTTTNSPRLYDGTAWTGFAGAAVSLTSGNGISLSPSTITSNGSISVNLGYNFIWTGSHTHNNAITFAAAQRFDITKLEITSQATGDLTYYSGTNWTRRAIGTDGQVLSVVSGVPTWSTISDGRIGTPADTSYSDGYFSTWTSSTTVADAFDDVNELLLLLAPTQGGLLTGVNLTSSGVTFYSAKVPSGLPAAWYGNGVTAGSTITSYYVTGTLSLVSPSPSTIFRAGKLNTPSSYGNVVHKLYTAAAPSGTAVDTIALSSIVSTPSTTGSLTITDFSTYNTIWKKANATISVVQTNEGYEGHSLFGTEAGESNTIHIYKDTVNPAPSFSTSPTATQNTASFKYLSGIQYYNLTSSFDMRFVAASGIFNRCYHPTKVAAINATGLTEVSVNPATTPVYTDTFDKSGANFVTTTLNVVDRNSLNKYITVTLNKPAGGTTSVNASISYFINTYTTKSTQTAEYFVDEAQRLVLGTNTAWTSTNALINGNAQVRNFTTANTGCLQVADGTDYPGFTGNQEYQRYFYKTSASTGSLAFGNILYTDIAAHGTGNINVLLYLENDAKWFDLAVPQGSNSNDGSSRALAISGRAFGSSGGTLNWSIGTYTTGPTSSGNLGRYRIVIIFRNLTTTKITSIVSS